MAQGLPQATNVAILYVHMYVYTHSLAYHLVMVWETWTTNKIQTDT